MAWNDKLKPLNSIQNIYKFLFLLEFKACKGTSEGKFLSMQLNGDSSQVNVEFIQEWSTQNMMASVKSGFFDKYLFH